MLTSGQVLAFSLILNLKTNTMEFLNHCHSGLRWIILILLVAAIGQAFSSMNSDKPFNRKLAMFAMIACHTQLLIGLIQYFAGNYYAGLPAEITDSSVISVHRFFRMEHIAMMILAIALITVGHSKSKKGASPKASYKSIAVFYTIGLLLILASIPWPFMQRFNTFGWF
jgi:cytochrome c biogenesis factor